MVSGIGSTLVDLFGPEAVEVLPGVSSVALARARMRWSAESSQVVSLVARDPHLLLRQLAPGHRVLVLSSDETTPAFVAALLTSYGYGASRVVVLGDLGSAEESRIEGIASTWSASSPRLNVLALELDGPVTGSWAAGLPDDAYGNDGQLTKRDLRAGALARLAPQPGQLLWDVGAGAGSVGIEWMRAHPRCRAIAVEADEDRATQIGFNARHLGVPHLEVVHGRAPDALADLPDPDAIFIGGGATEPGLLETCLTRLGPGGRLVVHGVTLETETLLAGLYAEHGGELTRHSVERAAPIGSFTGWTPARAVTMWAVAR
jgi:precorrin-6Y C5,15-methyltransferase (decarboxylating)